MKSFFFLNFKTRLKRWFEENVNLRVRTQISGCLGLKMGLKMGMRVAAVTLREILGVLGMF